jgi:hypothetical protein
LTDHADEGPEHPAPRERVPPSDDPSRQGRDPAPDPLHRLDEDAPAESTEPGYQDIDDRDGV